MNRDLALGFSFILAAAAFLSCAKTTEPIPPHGNYPPEIKAMAYSPSPPHAWQRISFQCTAADQNNDPLTYSWATTGGGFPDGNQAVAVVWRTPTTLGPQTLTVRVTDGTEPVTRDTTVVIVRMSPPGELTYTNGSNLVDLQWQPTVDDGLDGFVGYEVYSAGHTFESMPEESLADHILTPTPINRLQYRDLTAAPGEKRYYQIRARRNYSGIVERSPGGPEIDTASRIDGFGDALYEIASAHGAYGVQLRSGRQFPIEIAYRDSIDLYLGTPGDDGGGDVYLKSPSLLAYRDAAWGARATLLQSLGENWEATTPASDISWEESLPAVVGRVYALKTADGHYGKFRVLELRASPPERRIEFQWAWQPLAEYPRF